MRYACGGQLHIRQLFTALYILEVIIKYDQIYKKIWAYI